MNRTIYTELLRSEAIASPPPPERHTPLRQVALKLTRRGVMAAKAELANAALLAFIEILFDVDEDQNYANIDADGRILLPAPWGRNGSVHWGLRRSEQRALSWLLRRRMETEENPLFIYDDETRSWYVGRGYATGSTWGRQQLEGE